MPRAEEKRAYAMLDKYLLAEDNWHFSQTTLQRLVYTEYMPFADFGYDPQARHDVPIVELVGAMQARALADMFAPVVLQRLADMPTKAAPGSTMTLADLFTWTQRSIFGDLALGRPTTQIRRNEQRAYARMLARLATRPARDTPPDAQALARLELTNVAGDAKRALAKPVLDLQTRAHLVALRIDAEARARRSRRVIRLGQRERNALTHASTSYTRLVSRRMLRARGRGGRAAVRRRDERAAAAPRSDDQPHADRLRLRRRHLDGSA